MIAALKIKIKDHKQASQCANLARNLVSVKLQYLIIHQPFKEFEAIIVYCWNCLGGANLHEFFISSIFNCGG